MSSLWQIMVIVVVLVITDFLWFSTASSTTTSNQSNFWITRQNSTNTNPTWQGPPTTPWPALGARRPQNSSPTNTQSGNEPVQPQFGNTQNRNVNLGNTRNVGLDLSYGVQSGGNAGQNKQSIYKGSGNIGIDLSYGLNSNQNNNRQANQDKNRMSSQNLNFANIVQNTPSSQNANQNHQTLNRGQNIDKSIQNVPIPAQKPTIQTATSPGNTTNRISNVQSPNTMTGSAFQGENKTPSTPLNEDEELRDFSEALLKKDVNNAAKYVTINYQGKTTSRSANDEAPQPLLTIQKEAYNIPSIENLLLLYNNYILETNVNEHVSAQEKLEENNLLDTLLSTPVMQYTRSFLVQKGAIAKDPRDFKDKLKEIWFNMYSRGKGKIGSSGFEHVFLAEIKNDDISGLHNWLYFHDAEAKNQANYLGYLKKFDIGSNKGAILKYHFTLAGKDKPVGSMFIGTSPELEIALYSTCFLLRADKICPLRFGGKNFIIRTYTFRYRGKNMIGSAFPEI